MGMGAGGVGGTTNPDNLKNFGEGLSQSQVGDLLHTKVSTLGELKTVLTQNLGEQKGGDFYEQLVQSFAMQMLQQMQQTASQAKKAAKKMAQPPS